VDARLRTGAPPTESYSGITAAPIALAAVVGVGETCAVRLAIRTSSTKRAGTFVHGAVGAVRDHAHISRIGADAGHGPL